ncbi:Uncharacterised protein [Serratia proteamaculans]|nr:Uncharacterised protein [Serratia proteamaculans]
MSFLITHTGNSIDVQAIIVVQPLNGLSGLASWTSSKRITALSGFFMRNVCTRVSMVGYVGAPKGAPGSLLDRLRQPCVAHHPRLASTVVFHYQVGAHS